MNETILISLSILIPLLLIIMNRTIPIFFQKFYFLKHLSPFEITVNNWILGGLTGLLFLYFAPRLNNKLKLFDPKDFDYNFNKNINYFYVFFILLILGILSTLAYFYLLKKTDIFKITAYLNPIKIILIILISKFIFNEKITKGSFIGILIIILGLITVYYYQ